jgi:pimeloyl-ACP methyl ester carboxylesterase
VERRWAAFWGASRNQSWDERALLQTVQCPVLAVHGEHDPFWPAAHAREILDACSAGTRADGRSAVRVIGGVGHSIHQGAPAEFKAAVLPFLRRCLLGAAAGHGKGEG